MLSSQELYSALAPGYAEHFEAPHRLAYDTLAWERVRALLPARGPVVDAGCGVGRWVGRLTSLGYDVIGIEQAPGMIAELRRAALGPRFTLVESPMETAQLPDGSAGMVIAMGSLQYAPDPAAVIGRFARWVRPGGTVAVLVDSLVGLVIELLAAGKDGEAVQRLRTPVGTWTQGPHRAQMHLLDAGRLRAALTAAGLAEVEVSGLLTTAAPLGRAALAQRLAEDFDGQLDTERELARHPVLADIGKQLLGTGRRRPGRPGLSGPPGWPG